MLVKNTMNRVVKFEPERLIGAFLNDPEATVLESARLYPPVAGYNPFKIREDKTYKLKTGHTVTQKAGDFGVLINNQAHHDPTVFGGGKNDGEYAKKFDPTRPNLDRVLTWGNELRDIRKCPTSAGCDAAPRPCPGTHLALRVAKSTLSYFIEHAAKADKKEL